MHPTLLYGVQVFTVRREAAEDLGRLLHALREIGFTQIELQSVIYKHPANELRRMVEDAGLHAPAGHFALAEIASRIDYAKQLGLEYMVAMLPRPVPKTLDEYRAVAAEFQQAGERIHAAGMQFAYLFHNQDFQPQDGSTGFAELMRHTDPKMVKLEVDLYWVVQAGLDPAVFLREYKDRVRLLHLKDRLPGFPTSYTSDAASQHVVELGKGTIPWPALLHQARQQGIRYAFLDYDHTDGPVLDSLRESMGYLKQLKS